MLRRRFSTGESEFNPDKYLTIEALEDGLQISHANGFEYKTDNSGWQRAFQYELTTEINKGEFLYIRARWTNSNSSYFNITRRCNLRGNCLSLLFENNADKHHDISQFPHAFKNLFSHCPINEVASGFLPATILASECYENMFAVTPLTTAPELPATTLTYYCYNNIFHLCSNLNYIKMLATDISASGCLSDWVEGVASRGTFVKNPAMTTLPTGESGIPEGWTVVNDGEESGGLLEFTVDGVVYQFEDGMTWKDWCDSSYNTGGFKFYISDAGYAVYTSDYKKYFKTNMNLTALVEAGAYETDKVDWPMPKG